MSIFISFSKISPPGLFARSLLIIVLPIAIMQILVTYLFFDLHWAQVSKSLSSSAAADVSYITEKYLANPTPENFEVLRKDASEHLRLSVALQKDAQLPKTARNATIPAFDRTLRAALTQSTKRDFWFDTTRYPDYVDIRVKIPNGVLRFLAYRDRVFASTGGIFLIWVIGATVLLATVAVLFIRNQVRPMERLADAAERFGRGETIELKPAGSREIRRATQAFLDMRSRIMRHIEQRTNILAGVSHDLRTPLTRLKLELAMMGDAKDIKAAHADIKQMEDMLEEYLTFARGQWSEEAITLDMAQIALNSAQNAKRNFEAITTNGLDSRLPATGRAAALKRALDNIIENATSFGSRVLVSGEKNNEYIFIHIDDNGPGLDPSLYKEALNPFTRLDPARNQNRKGVGLGLSIARDVAMSHGGEIVLSKSELGGLRVSLKLPLA